MSQLRNSRRLWRFRKSCRKSNRLRASLAPFPNPRGSQCVISEILFQERAKFGHFLTMTSPNDPGSRACFSARSTPSPSADASVIGWIWPTPEPYHWPQRRLCLGQYRETRQKLPILVAGSKFARLAAGGNRIRTIGSAEKETASRKARGRSSRLARRPVLNDPIQLIGPASLVGNSRETFHKSGTDGSNTVPSSGESTLELQTDSLICSCDRI